MSLGLKELRAEFSDRRASLLLRDEARLARQLGRAKAGKFDDQRFLSDLEKAARRADARKANIPGTISYPEELPVSQARESLKQSILDHQVVVICGETGSGKTTQLPKLCMELGRGTRGLIGHTQPRRLAARSVANRIASELKTQVGGLVGFETRFDRRLSETSAIKLMTDGILLAELQRDRQLLAYDTIIIDEAHERSLNIDFLLGWLKQLLPSRPELKVIVTSATLDPERLSRHFSDAPILTVEGRAYPVEVRYSPMEAEEGDTESAVASAIESLWSSGQAADTLVFLPGEREIRDLARMLGGRFPNAQVLPLFSRLPAEQQDKVFKSSGAPRIVLSTNVAETSVTVPGIRYVVDTGTARMNRWSARLGIQQLHIEAISQAAANQRAGRCGRVGPGICVRLYGAEDFESRPPFTDPEVRRANLAGVILQMATLGLGDIDSFTWLESPDSRQVSDGYRLLQTLGALDEDRKLTTMGRELARLPLDPRVARIALSARGTACETEVWVLAAALSVQDPHEFPPESQTQARQKHALWQNKRSDFLSMLGLWSFWQTWSDEHSNRQLRKQCKNHYVSYLRMEEWESVYRQISDLLGERQKKRKLPPIALETIDKHYAAIHQALLAGLIDHIGLKLPEKKEYQGPRGRRFLIFPGSRLKRANPQWLMCASIVHTSQVFARTCAGIEPVWLESAAPHLIRRTFQDPAWEASRGEVSCTEHLSIFGLALMRKRRHYGSINASEAREIFLLEGLVRGEIQNKPPFLKQNLNTIEQIKEKEARLRRPDLLGSETQLIEFYASRIPDAICTVTALRKWIKQADEKIVAGLRMRESDALRTGSDANVHKLFPDHLTVGTHRIRLSYAHDPGADADGVSAHIPMNLLHELPPEPFEWLVPGLLAARIEGLLRTLPQKVRRHCTPAAEYAAALAESLDPSSGPLIPAMCKRFKEMNSYVLDAAEFEPERLDPHLKMRFILQDDKRKRVAESDDLEKLRTSHTGAARQQLARSAEKDETLARWVRSPITNWDFEDMPDSVGLAGGARAWPVLKSEEKDGGTTISLALMESAEAAQATHRIGVRDLLLLGVKDRIKDLTRSAKKQLGLSAIHSPVSPEAIARAVADRAAEESWPLSDIRNRQAFDQALQFRGEFGRKAAAYCEDVCGWLKSAAALRSRLRELGEKNWPHAQKDLKQQLNRLFCEGFVQHVPEEHWDRIAIYLKAASIRLDRLPNKPQRDLELTQQQASLCEKIPGPAHPAYWIAEEWRISLFAQELRAKGSPNADRIREALRRS